MERIIRRFAGTFILISLALAHYHNEADPKTRPRSDRNKLCWGVAEGVKFHGGVVKI